MPNSDEKIMRICDWVNLFENNRTKELKRLDWVPIPNRMDGDAYTELLDDHPNGAAHLGVWLALVLIASRCDPRGTLLRESRTRLRESRSDLRESRTVLRDGDEIESHTSQSLARMSHLPAGLIDEAIPRLIKIGWLELIDREQYTYEISHLPAGLSHLPAGLSHLPAGLSHPPAGLSHPPAALTRARGTERKGMERKGMEDRRPPSPEAPGSDPTTEQPPLKDPERKNPETEAERIAWCRESLLGFVQDCEAKTWKEPDDEICQQTLAVGRGRIAVIGQALLELHRKGKRPEVSWAWFPKMIGEILSPPRMAHETKGTKVPFLKEAAG